MRGVKCVPECVHWQGNAHEGVCLIDVCEEPNEYLDVNGSFGPSGHTVRIWDGKSRDEKGRLHVFAPNPASWMPCPNGRRSVPGTLF